MLILYNKKISKADIDILLMGDWRGLADQQVSCWVLFSKEVEQLSVCLCAEFVPVCMSVSPPPVRPAETLLIRDQADGDAALCALSSLTKC